MIFVVILRRDLGPSKEKSVRLTDEGSVEGNPEDFLVRRQPSEGAEINLDVSLHLNGGVDVEHNLVVLIALVRLHLVLVILVSVYDLITKALDLEDSKVHLDLLAWHRMNYYFLQQLDGRTLYELPRIKRLKVVNESYLARLRDAFLIGEAA